MAFHMHTPASAPKHPPSAPPGLFLYLAVVQHQAPAARPYIGQAEQEGQAVRTKVPHRVGGLVKQHLDMTHSTPQHTRHIHTTAAEGGGGD